MMEAATEVNEHPILMDDESMRAIMGGDATGCVRAMPQPPHGCSYVVNASQSAALCFAGDSWPDDGTLPVLVPPTPQSRDHLLPSPYGAPGDRLRVRESLRVVSEGLEYAADGELIEMTPAAWDLWNRRAAKEGPDVRATVIPSRYMPPWASRLTLEMTSLRVVQMQDLTDGMIRATGCNGEPGLSPLDEFRGYWNRNNTKRGNPYDLNLWVWYFTFRRVEAAHA